MALTTSLSTVLDGLYKKLGLDLSGLDYEEQDKRRSYDNNIFKSLQDRVKGITGSNVNMADRGLSRSGAALQQTTDVNLAADTNNANFQQGFASDLSAIARKRVEAESNYNLKKLELEHQATAAQEVVPPLAETPTTFNPTQAAQTSISNSAAKAPARIPVVAPKNTTPPRTNYSVTKTAVRPIAAPAKVAPRKVAPTGRRALI